MDFSSCEWGKGLMGLATLNPVENYLYTSHYPFQVDQIFFKFKEDIVQGHKIANKIVNDIENCPFDINDNNKKVGINAMATCAFVFGELRNWLKVTRALLVSHEDKERGGDKTLVDLSYYLRNMKS
jgi:hypothetical protein